MSAVNVVEVEEARRLFGRNFLGPEATSGLFGVDLFGAALTVDQVHDSSLLPFSRDDLQRAKSLEMMLVFRISHDKYGNALTINYLREVSEIARLKIFRDRRREAWYQHEFFAGDESPAAGWSLVRKEVIPESLGKAWHEQSSILKQWARDSKMPTHIVGRRTAVEAIYDTVIYYTQVQEPLLHEVYDWTTTKTPDRWPVLVGGFDSPGGLIVDAAPAESQNFIVGACPSISAAKIKAGDVVRILTNEEDSQVFGMLGKGTIATVTRVLSHIIEVENNEGMTQYYPSDELSVLRMV